MKKHKFTTLSNILFNLLSYPSLTLQRVQITYPHLLWPALRCFSLAIQLTVLLHCFQHYQLHQWIQPWLVLLPPQSFLGFFQAVSHISGPFPELIYKTTLLFPCLILVRKQNILYSIVVHISPCCIVTSLIWLHPISPSPSWYHLDIVMFW